MNPVDTGSRIYTRTRITVLCAMFISLLVGCAPTIVNLEEPSGFPRRAAPLELVAKIESFEVVPAEGNGFEHERFVERGLADELREANLFSTVVYPAGEWTEADVTLRGRVSHRWPSVAGDVFVTHFPGGLIFMPSWHGLQYPFEAKATVDLIDGRSGSVVETYEASTSHQFVHKSANPAHFLGAAVIVPAVVRGAVLGHARGKRRTLTYEVAYPELWRKIVQQIAADDLRVDRRLEGPADRGPSRSTGCEGDLAGPPRIGEEWERYRSCSESRFRLTGQIQLPEGVASIYQEDASDGIEVYVVDGNVLRWSQP